MQTMIDGMSLSLTLFLLVWCQLADKKFSEIIASYGSFFECLRFSFVNHVLGIWPLLAAAYSSVGPSALRSQSRHSRLRVVGTTLTANAGSMSNFGSPGVSFGQIYLCVEFGIMSDIFVSYIWYGWWPDANGSEPVTRPTNTFPF